MSPSFAIVDPRLAESALIATLRESAAFQALSTALKEMAGLTVALIPAWQWPPSKNPAGCGNPLCAAILSQGGVCDACSRFSCCKDSVDSPQTIKCIGELHQMAIAIREGEHVLGFVCVGPFLIGKSRIRSTTLMKFPITVRRQFEALPLISADLYCAVNKLTEVICSEISRIAIHATVLEKPIPLGIQRISTHVRQNFRNPILLVDMARMAGMSREHFCRTFRKTIGISFSEFVNQVRIEAAKIKLSNSALQITEVAASVGFKSLTHFNRSFRKIVGRSPSDYRHRIRNATEDGQGIHDHDG